jgi:hypothetical protein
MSTLTHAAKTVKDIFNSSAFESSLIRNLTDKEREELDKLAEDHKELVLKKKGEMFLNLDPKIRENIILSLKIDNAVDLIKEANFDDIKTERYKELEQKQNGIFPFISGNIEVELGGLTGSSILLRYFNIEKLEELHKQACVEEMIGDR